ncbi:acetyltransferase [Lacticaseibacillus rhamnosus]|nr:acetyltransferase [Lacticaseibacillus rhamnosus]MCT3152723.1 acetyltransferase [Lacticaseibacillus rhamnosus]MCT3162962.1 acetyltransferase [Lacticaseibacillus rhamnosus]MCT3165888.1 acetyltransferase [Lacticaseibacillus rhamnosus]MCT3175388.1 acetyltransferase [Lacticaseibacillus rhamnosus]
MTRSPAQGSACKNLGRNGQARAITPKATYTPIPNRAGSRSLNPEEEIKWTYLS